MDEGSLKFKGKDFTFHQENFIVPAGVVLRPNYQTIQSSYYEIYYTTGKRLYPQEYSGYGIVYRHFESCAMLRDITGWINLKEQLDSLPKYIQDLILFNLDLFV